ncbi:arginyl-tRNA synthetase [Marinitoga hydrogenitolerans DSM 16785]|uniref:Arginine--tRNA ligase n=1 Tax=Marinitoga hydrogenitolerans (strain DSM 16785 / JCM 12826 / AT1271) TaxID=1122195 RepID=A0A1M4YAZ9_MARH1|nr:arginine--tRNA ligase [Marinitoga hydrogenitolerans]SHF02808.1 arginyl-tRNA synthetase [Marinitoga hydrogenitolerans DSM 16785]
MKLVEKILEDLLKKSVEKIFPNAEVKDPVVQRTSNENFGDFQTNFAMINAKVFKKAPRVIAQDIIDNIPENEIIEKIEIAGPGFINIFIKNDFLVNYLPKLEKEEPDFSFITDKGTVVIDYSSPNIAKPMHIGHLRSTVIGDSIKRIYKYLGYDVIGDNHLGDWGTQFGKLIVAYRLWLDREHYEKDPIGEMERIYVKFEKEAEKNPELLEEARQELKKLQDGETENRKLWQEFIDLSLKEYNKIYRRMDIEFDTYYGESHYHSIMPEIVKMLLEKGIATYSEGAVVVFFDEKENLPPAIIQKKDGAFLYATSDLACIKFRRETYHPNRILYVTDERQQTHFKQVFNIARKLGWEDNYQHIWFGLMRFADGVFSTRKGNVIKLQELLDKAVEKAKAIIEEKNPELSEEEKSKIAEIIGIGAVKYADLSQNRISHIIFDWDKMLAFDGNTAPYLLYTYARIQSLKRKAKDNGYTLDNAEILINEKLERKLSLLLTQLPIIVMRAADDYKPNLIADYLFELAQTYNSFYNSLSVLKEEEKVLKSRLLLSHLAGEVLRKGLDLLGIKVVDKM